MGLDGLGLGVFFLLRAVVFVLGFFSIAAFALDIFERIPRSEIPLLAVAAELLMLENILIGLIAYFVEVIHIELADKG